MPKLIVLAAFDKNDDGELVPAFDPREMQSEQSAKTQAAALAPHHAGVIAWSRDADPNTGDYGEPVELARYGEVPEME